jgi:hypothetical protein
VIINPARFVASGAQNKQSARLSDRTAFSASTSSSAWLTSLTIHHLAAFVFDPEIEITAELNIGAPAAMWWQW